MIVSLFASAQKATQSEVLVVTENIIYETLFMDLNNQKYWTLPVGIDIDTGLVEVFFETLINYASGKKAKGVNSFAPKMLNTDFTTPGKYLDEPIVFENNECYSKGSKNKLAFIRFSEKWLYDEQNKKFSKEIFGYSPAIALYDDFGELRGVMPLFWLWTDRLSASSGKDIVLGQNIIYDVVIRTLNVLCGEDVYWGDKYEFLETNYEKDNINVATRQEFVLSVLRDMCFGNLEVKDQHGKILSVEETKNIIFRKDTTTFVIENDETEKYDLVDYVITPVYNINRFSIVRFLEEWSYNPVSMRFTKKVIAIGFIYRAFDEYENGYGGIDSYEEPELWVYF